MGNPPAAVGAIGALGGLDVRPGDQRQQCYRLPLLLVEKLEADNPGVLRGLGLDKEATEQAVTAAIASGAGAPEPEF